MQHTYSLNSVTYNTLSVLFFECKIRMSEDYKHAGVTCV